MGRLPRLQFAGACYHVTLIGDGGDAVFLDDADRAKALALLGEMRRRFHVRLYAYCLLDARIDLALETAEPNLSRAMQGFGTAYTKYLNGRRKRTGHVFAGRYRSALVDKGEALAELTRRIHLLPVDVTRSTQPATRNAVRYPWSSCRAYTEGPRGDGLVETDAILPQFGRSRFRQSIKYLKFLNDDLPSPVHGRGGGGESAVAALPKSLSTPALLPQVGGGSGVGALIDLDALLRETAARHGVSVEAVRDRFRCSAICRARREMARRAWDAGAKVADIAAALRKSSAAVSRMVHKQDSQEKQRESEPAMQ